MSGRFITFEGPEGSGKSTHAVELAAALRAAGHTVLLTREPGGTPLAEKIRALVQNVIDDPPIARCELLLLLAARAQHVETVIKPALARGEWVICDRFCDSTMAYQGYGRGLDAHQIDTIDRFSAQNLRPDLTLLLDVPPAVSAARLAVRQAQTATEADRFEQAGLAFHTRLRNGFLELARNEPHRFAVIDSSGTQAEVAQAIQDAVKVKLPDAGL